MKLDGECGEGGEGVSTVEPGPETVLSETRFPPVPEPGAIRAVRVREHVCAGGESGVCPGACCTRHSECWRRELHRQGAAF